MVRLESGIRHPLIWNPQIHDANLFSRGDTPTLEMPEI
jgi:hypothetical protein